MEEKKIQEIFDALKSEGLTERERFVMRSELQLLMKNHPLKVPFHIRMAEKLSAFDTAAFNYVGSHSIVMATLALVLVVGVGTSYAAGGALPGDVLYPLKINVNEKVEGALAVSDVAKVQWSAQQTQNRLEEAEVLAAKGQLNDKTSSEITAQLDASAQSFDQNVAALAKAPDSEDEVADAQSNLDASLAAHEQVLASLGDQIPDAKQAISPILSNVRGRVEVAVARSARAMPTLMAAATFKTASTTSEKQDGAGKAAATRKKQRAQQTLNEVRDLTAQVKGTISSSTFMYLHTEASSTEQTISAGDKNADEGNYDQALQSYQEALKVSAEAKAGLNAEIHLRQNVKLLNLNFISTNNDDDATTTDESGKGGQ